MTKNQQITAKEEIVERLFEISSEISMFMLFLKHYENNTNSDCGIELQKRLVSFRKFKEEYSQFLDFKYWNDPQNVRRIKELIENGSANTVDAAIKLLNL